ncbi:hypothetical protein R5R35_001332 [Gryllus longicercus]|uniref:Uncharacterized protein n=1 Tax=Gryllus longicercus TaxID=2509291 RepID=A0AAN9VCL3_9ORTH
MEITLFLMILYGLLALSVIPLFFSTIHRNVVLTLPYLALQMAKLLSEVVLAAVGVALAPWNARHAQICAIIITIRLVTLGWDFYLLAAVFSFLQRSRYL